MPSTAHDAAVGLALRAEMEHGARRRKGEMEKEKENKNCVEEIYGKNGVGEIKTKTSHVVCLCF